MQGQVTHFLRHVSEDIPYAIARYKNESRRLYSILDTQLAKKSHGYIVGDKFTIVDIAFWPLVAVAPWSGIELGEFPAVEEWYNRLLQRPSIARGMNVPEEHGVTKMVKDVSGEETEKLEKFHREWVVKGMKLDAEQLEERKKSG